MGRRTMRCGRQVQAIGSAQLGIADPRGYVSAARSSDRMGSPGALPLRSCDGGADEHQCCTYSSRDFEVWVAEHVRVGAPHAASNVGLLTCT